MTKTWVTMLDDRKNIKAYYNILLLIVIKHSSNVLVANHFCKQILRMHTCIPGRYKSIFLILDKYRNKSIIFYTRNFNMKVGAGVRTCGKY